MQYSFKNLEFASALALKALFAVARLASLGEIAFFKELI